MPVTFHIPGPLTHLAGGQRDVTIEDSPATLREALEALWVMYPGIRDRIVTEQGDVREHVNVFVGSEEARYLGGLSAPLSPEAEISIIPAISGGDNVPGPPNDIAPGRPGDDLSQFRDAVKGLLHGDFSRSEPLFVETPNSGRPCRIREWYDKGYFENEPEALAEALSCACFLGQTRLAEFLLDRGVEITAGFKTGMNGFHWAADRGQLETVRMLIARQAPLEIRNMYGGTVLGFAVWSAIHETRPTHGAIIEALIAAGARVEEAVYPTGNPHVDELLRRHGAHA